MTKRNFSKHPPICKTTEREKRKRVVIESESLPKKLSRGRHAKKDFSPSLKRKQLTNVPNAILALSGEMAFTATSGGALVIRSVNSRKRLYKIYALQIHSALLVTSQAQHRHFHSGSVFLFHETDGLDDISPHLLSTAGYESHTSIYCGNLQCFPVSYFIILIFSLSVCTQLGEGRTRNSPSRRTSHT